MLKVLAAYNARGRFLSAVRQSAPSGTSHRGFETPRFETVGNRLYPLHDQDCLRRFTAEAQIQDRSRAKTGPNTAPGFLRVSRRLSRALPRHSRKARRSRAGGNPEKNKARHLPLSRSPNDRRRGAEAQTTANRDRGGCPRTLPRHSCASPCHSRAGGRTQRKTKHADSPPSHSARGPKRPIQAKPKGPTRERMMPGDGRGLPGSQPLPQLATYAHPAISQHAREQQWFRNRLHVRVSRRPTVSGLNCAQIDKQ